MRQLFQGGTARGIIFGIIFTDSTTPEKTVFTPAAPQCAQITDNGVTLHFRDDGAPVDPDRMAELLAMPDAVRQECREAAAKFLKLTAELKRFDKRAAEHKARIKAERDKLAADHQALVDGEVADGFAEQLAGIEARSAALDAELAALAASRKPLADLVEQERPRAERAARKVAAAAYQRQREVLAAERERIAAAIARAINQELGELATVSAALATVEQRTPDQTAGQIHSWMDSSVYG
jgi:hypothetical protein